MTRRSLMRLSRKQPIATAAPTNIAKRLWILVAASVLVAVSIGAMDMWEIWFPPPAEKLVTVYRSPGCRCFASWANAIKSGGFAVQAYGVDSLERVRERLHIPVQYHGCHVAKYLGYFLEGHVGVEALQRLRQEHPNALGIVTQATLEARIKSQAIRDQRSPVLLVNGPENTKLWFYPNE